MSLKDFIEENRRDFDDELPGLHNWTAIENNLSKKTPLKRRIRIAWAAAILILVASSVTAIVLYNSNHTSENPVTNDPQIPEEFVGWPAEFAAKAKAFYEKIEVQQKSLSQVVLSEPGLASQFQSDLAALDSAYQILHRQASQTPGSEVLIKAMIQNLQLQAELLSKQLQIIHQYSLNKKNSHENDKNSSRSL